MSSFIDMAIIGTIYLAICLPIVMGHCKVPPPSSNFTLQGYYGLWFEIGKFQTAGGAFFERDCVCTTLEVYPKKDAQAKGDCTALNSCRKKTSLGKYLNATGELIDMTEPGKWKEQFFVLTPAVDYTVIYLDSEFAVEYDCSEFLGVTNYCIHVLSRSQTPDPDLVKKVVEFALSLGLNTEHLPFRVTQQVTCW